VHIISGEVDVTDEKGEIRCLRPGEMAFFPAGSRSIWHTPHRVRKLAVCRHSMPRPLGTVLRAWNKLVESAMRVSSAAAGKRVRGMAPARAVDGVPSA
jgi:EutQ-like cupin domain